MKFIKTPIKGMNDYLPGDTRLREYVISVIKDTYSSFGFAQIETPSVEHIENLSNKEGGENEKLIFRILKRGEKLDLNVAETTEDLVDSGLRYDLTVPLARYYANNAENLFTPFKALQIGNVWRADRPQKGRFRQFTQCDIDILGDDSRLAETELVSATSTLLLKLGFKGFKVRINDRRILKAMALYSGFSEDGLDKVYITLDKLDKIGEDGVRNELLSSGFSAENVERYLSLFQTSESDHCYSSCSAIHEHIDTDILKGIDEILATVRASCGGEFSLVFDPTLVRGMSYYTGTIFEIEMAELGSSVAGGGRYDEMIGKFGGTQVQACGFSIGFERIVTILKDQGFTVPAKTGSVTFLIEKGVSSEKLCEVMKEAAELRASGIRVMVTKRNKNAKYQKDKLISEGYTEFKDIY